MIRLGLFLHGGDGPMRWDVEALDEVSSPRAAAVLRLARLLTIPADCSYAWRAACAIRDTVREFAPRETLQIHHTHGAPVAYVDGCHQPGLRYYHHHRRPMTAAMARALRRLGRSHAPGWGTSCRRTRRRLLAEARFRAMVGHRAKPDMYHPRCYRKLRYEGDWA